MRHAMTIDKRGLSFGRLFFKSHSFDCETLRVVVLAPERRLQAVNAV
jgi:hypothetical protein